MSQSNNTPKNPLLNYENKWVALDKRQEKVVHSAKTLSALQKLIIKQKKRDLIVTKVMPFNVSLAPNVTASD